MTQLKSFKWHPQPSSARKATAAAKRFDMRQDRVLDCFCGTGTHGIAAIAGGARMFIGTDLEDYSWCMRDRAARYNKAYQNFEGNQTIYFEWGLDAKESVMSHDYDVLFIDPPNPYQIVGGSPLSMCRDTGLSGNELTKYWKARFDSTNMINKKSETITYVKDIVQWCLNDGKRVLANLFVIKSNKFDYATCFDRFVLRPMFESYYEIAL